MNADSIHQHHMCERCKGYYCSHINRELPDVAESVEFQNVAYFNYGRLYYHCDGCKIVHSVTTQYSPSTERVRWSWNNSLLTPTVSPSVHCLPYHAGEKQLVLRCHHFVENGVLVYCGDCDHQFASQRIPLKPVSLYW